MNPAPQAPSFSPPGNGVTTIAYGVKVEGDFTSQGDVVIEGEVRGKIASSGALTVGSKAVIKADVSADEANVSGLVEGNLTIKKQAVLHATAKIKGDLTAERITVESGATLDGRVQVGAKDAPPKPDPKMTSPKTSTGKLESGRLQKDVGM